MMPAFDNLELLLATLQDVLASQRPAVEEEEETSLDVQMPEAEEECNFHYAVDEAEEAKQAEDLE
jgi:hypothetical protein